MVFGVGSTQRLTHQLAQITEVTSLSGSTFSWNNSLSDGYGALPGTTKPSPLIAGANVASQLGWRGHYIDPTGLYYLGARYYAPDSGTFLSPDPLGHSASMDLYSYCDGDPVNQYDADGRLKTGFNSGLNGNIAPSAPNTPAFYAGNLLGSAVSGAAKGYQQPITFGTGVQGGANYYLGGFSVNGGVYFGHSEDNGWTVGLLGTYGSGPSRGIGASGGGFVQVTDATSVQNLKGGGFDFGTSAKGEVIPITWGVSYNRDTPLAGGTMASPKTYNGSTINFGVGEGTPLEAHTYGTITGGWVR